MCCPTGKQGEPGVPINGEHNASCGIIFENGKIRILTDEESKNLRIYYRDGISSTIK